MGVIVTLDEAKGFIRIGTDSVNAVLQAIIDGAEDYVAKFCSTPLTAATFTDVYDGACEYLWLTQCPICSITSVTDLYNVFDLTSTDYTLIRDRLMYTCGTTNNLWWQAGGDRWQVKYIAGYNNGNDVAPEGSIAAPAGLKLAILQLIHRVYEARGGVATMSSQGVSRSWNPANSINEGDIADLLEPYKFGGRF